MRLAKPRISPLPKSQWTEEQHEALSGSLGIGTTDGEVVNVLATLARYPKLLRAWGPFGGHILGDSSLPPREREILILRIGWLCRSAYEFGQHTLIGKAAGLEDAEIRRITEGPDAPGWSDADALLLRAVDELHGDAFISDATWNALVERYDESQLMDIVFTVGQYNLVSMALNSFGVQLDGGVPGFPD